MRWSWLAAFVAVLFVVALVWWNSARPTAGAHRAGSAAVEEPFETLAEMTPAVAAESETLALLPQPSDGRTAVPSGPGARASAVPPAKPKRVVRGRAVDTTGAPLGDVDVGLVFRTEESKTFVLKVGYGTRLGAGGSFELSSADPERLVARVVQWSTGKNFEGDVEHRYADERLADDTWRVVVRVGWFARVELVPPLGLDEDVYDFHPSLESATFFETVADEERAWRAEVWRARDSTLWCCAVSGIELDPTRDHSLVVEARAALEFDGLTGRVALSGRGGIQPDVVRVPLERRVRVSGRVVDERGMPWSGVVIEFDEVERSSGPRGATATDARGAFELRLGRPGLHVVRVSAPLTAPQTRELSFAPGRNELGDFELPRGARGAVTGLVSVPDGDGLDVLLVLRDPRSAAELVERTSGHSPCRFLFSDVPRGTYELEVVPRDGRRYAAPRLVEVPGPELGIVAEASDARVAGEHLDVRDVVTRALVEDASALVLCSGGWSIRDRSSAWSRGETLALVAPGYQARLDAAAREPAAASPRREILLTPGWGRLVLFRAANAPMLDAWSGRGIAGVRCLADGRELARSDAAGLAVLALERAPREVTFELAGRRVLDSQVSESVQLVRME